MSEKNGVTSKDARHTAGWNETLYDGYNLVFGV